MEISNKKFNEFLMIMEDYGEYLFGTKKQIKKQLELVLSTQGYWSGCSIRVYFNKDTKEFLIVDKYSNGFER